MRQQTGCIYPEGESWRLRYRETVNSENGSQRKMKCKTLGPVLPEHRRNVDKKTNKLRIPADIQEQADAILAGVAGSAPDKALLSLASQMITASPELAQKMVGLGKVTKVNLAQVLGEISERRQDRRRFSEVVPDFFTAQEKHLKPATIFCYRQMWDYLKSYLESRVLADVTRADVSELWEAVQRDHANFRRGTFNLLRGFMASLFEWAADKGLYSGENPSKAGLPKDLPGKRETHAYSVEDVRLMLSELFVDRRIQAIIALAFGGGLGKSEISGLDWNDYERIPDKGAIIHVQRAVWRGRVGDTKTTNRASDIRLGESFCVYVDAYRERLGNPSSGFMFMYANSPASLDGIARQHIRPVLNYCSVCAEKYKGLERGLGCPYNHVDSPADLGKFPGLEDHVYTPRSERLPHWYGWHAFRRGNATFLATCEKEAEKLGISADELAALQLRHGGADVTREHYIKGRTAQDDRIARARKVIDIREKVSEQRFVAASALDAGLKNVQ